MDRMIENIPESTDFDRAAKASFFAGWNELMHILADFDTAFPPGDGPDDDWPEERKEYFEHCQVEFGMVVSHAAHANELALKSRICEVSPFLLILGTDPKFKVTQDSIDFSELRTVDAVDLPSMVNTLCGKKLSENFNNRYSNIRKLRNRIAHQGAAGSNFDPINLVLLLSEQYADLWPEKRFLRDWYEYLSSTRFSFFHDGKWSTAGMELVEMLDVFFKTVKSKQIESLTGYEKNKRRYACGECYYSESIGNSGGGIDSYRTAYLVSDTTLYCQICEGKSSVVRDDCIGQDCKGNVIGDDAENAGMCLTCGASQEAM